MQEIAQENFQFCEKTLELKSVIESSFLTLGERLRKIRGEELWRGQWTSFNEYVKEMKMSEATATKLINIYDKFIVKFGFEPQRVIDAGGWGVVAEVLPMVKSQADAIKWLDKCIYLSREDLRIEVRLAKTGIPPEECPHADTYIMKICRLCGDKHLHEEKA